MKFKERQPTIEAARFDGSQRCIGEFESILLGIFKGYTLESYDGHQRALTLHTTDGSFRLSFSDWLVNDGGKLQCMTSDEMRNKYEPA